MRGQSTQGDFLVNSYTFVIINLIEIVNLLAGSHDSNCTFLFVVLCEGYHQKWDQFTPPQV